MATYLKRAVERPVEDLTAVRQTVSEILERIQKEGMDAVRFYSKKFDGWEPRSFRLSADEIRAARRALPASEIADIDFCQAQIRNFAAEQMRRLVGFEVETLPGVHLGQKIIPVASSGSYVPGGRYPMLASAHMTVITPKVAGVKRIVASSPPAKGQGPWPATVYSMAAAGADEIYCMGGVHALAAMAYGMEGLAPVDMVVGAGNKYVAEAKRQLFGTVGIDLLAGPTEILIICDETADPSIVAADLLGQAEHDPNARQALVSLSEKTARDTMAELEKQLAVLPTREIAGPAWGSNGDVIVVDSPAEAVQVSDEWAPEHLEVQTKDWRYYLEQLPQLRLGLPGRGDDRRLRRQDHRHQPRAADDAGGALHGRAVGRQVREDGDLPVRHPRGLAQDRRGLRAGLQLREHAGARDFVQGEGRQVPGCEIAATASSPRSAVGRWPARGACPSGCRRG